jgi:hypothetical protein
MGTELRIASDVPSAAEAGGATPVVTIAGSPAGGSEAIFSTAARRVDWHLAFATGRVSGAVSGVGLEGERTALENPPHRSSAINTIDMAIAPASAGKIQLRAA